MDFVNYPMQQAISGEVIHNLMTTFVVSCNKPNGHYTSKVKMSKDLNNPQVTKAPGTLLGTSEAIRLFSYFPGPLGRAGDQKFYEWLAGLIDGDGSFLLSKKGYASLEITMDIRDEHCLNLIKNRYGGSIKLRAGMNALRYRLHHKLGLLALINDINGKIRNPNRMIQLDKICNKYNIIFIFPKPLIYDCGWLSGFIDADGTITINQSNLQLSISASQKTTHLLEPLVSLYGGFVYIDRGKYESFKWNITKQEDILNLISYFKLHPIRSSKKNRAHLIPKFYELKAMKAHLAEPNSALAKAWQVFLIKWKNFEHPEEKVK
jgi:hypothetical protein